jgi:hypothetical protein
VTTTTEARKELSDDSSYNRPNYIGTIPELLEGTGHYCVDRVNRASSKATRLFLMK